MEYQNFETLVSSLHISNDDIPFITVEYNQSNDRTNSNIWYLAFKRTMDIFLSSFMLVLFSPLLVIVYLMICIIINENGIFTQKRVGLNEKEFTIYKFRTMRKIILSTEIEKLLKFNESRGVVVKTSNDPRLYGFGKFLRKTSIDELPQLINVFLGNMSFVGPRPLMDFIVSPYPEIKKARTVVKPGITGLWQTSARGNNTSVLQMIAYDTEYIRNFSLLADIKILIKTIGVVIKCKGAV
ncbi:MAG: sugar transferase [bacterium]